MRSACLAATCLLLGGCATSSLVLLPDDEGHQGAVAVLETDGKPADTPERRASIRQALFDKANTIGHACFNAELSSAVIAVVPVTA